MGRAGVEVLGVTTCFVPIRPEPGEDPEVLGVFASKDMGSHVMDESVRADEEASYMPAEAEVRQ